MSNEEIKFDCPACGEGLAIDRRAIGHQVACPFCKDSIMVPEIEEPAAIELEPLGLKERAKADTGAASLEELANSRPESPKIPPKSWQSRRLSGAWREKTRKPAPWFVSGSSPA